MDINNYFPPQHKLHMCSGITNLPEMKIKPPDLMSKAPRLNHNKSIINSWYGANSSSSSTERMELTLGNVRHNRLCNALQQLEECVYVSD